MCAGWELIYMAAISKDFFRTIGRRVNNQFFVENEFNYSLKKLCDDNLILPDLVGNLPKSTYKSQVLKELPIKNGQKLLNVQEYLARSVQGELERIGIDLPPDYYRNHKKLLSVVYMISSLAVVFVESKDGSGYSSYLATKNATVLKYLIDAHAIRAQDIPKNLDKYFDRCNISSDELDSAKIEVVKLTPTPTGKNLKLGMATIYPNSSKTFVLPYFVVRKYTNNLITILSNKKAKIDFKSGSKPMSVCATLQPAEALNKSLSYIATMPSKLVVYDYVNREYMALNILDVVNIN